MALTACCGRREIAGVSVSQNQGILLANSAASKFLFAFHFFEGVEAWKKLGGNLGSIAVK
jgi:hypothetical protein